MNKTSILLFLALFAFLVISLIFKRLSSQNTFIYQRTPILTDNEAEFYGRLTEALPWATILPQTAMSALVQPGKNLSQKQRMSAFGRIAQKRIDFVICKPDLDVVCVIELDDKTHNRAKDAQRDKILSSAGIPTLRYQSRAADRPTANIIRRDVATLGQAFS